MTTEWTLEMETSRRRPVGGATVFLCDLPWSAVGLFRRTGGVRLLQGRILNFECEGTACRPVLISVGAALAAWIAETEEDNPVQECVTAEEAPGEDQQPCSIAVCFSANPAYSCRACSTPRLGGACARETRESRARGAARPRRTGGGGRCTRLAGRGRADRAFDHSRPPDKDSGRTDVAPEAADAKAARRSGGRAPRGSQRTSSGGGVRGHTAREMPPRTSSGLLGEESGDLGVPHPGLHGDLLRPWLGGSPNFEECGDGSLLRPRSHGDRADDPGLGQSPSGLASGRDAGALLQHCCGAKAVDPSTLRKAWAAANLAFLKGLDFLESRVKAAKDNTRQQTTSEATETPNEQPKPSGSRAREPKGPPNEFESRRQCTALPLERPVRDRRFPVLFWTAWLAMPRRL